MATLTFITPTALAATPQQIALVNLVEVIDDATRAVGTEMSLGVDPQVVHGLAETARIFSGNFCGPYAEAGKPDPCDTTLFASGQLRSILRNYFEDLLRRPAQIESFPARLARAAGEDLGRAGWGTESTNSVGVLVLEHESSAQVGIRTATGHALLGANVLRVLVNPGAHRLYVLEPGKEEVVLVVNVAPRAQIFLKARDAQAALTSIGRIDVPKERYCVETFGSSAPLRRSDHPLAPFNWARANFDESDDAKIQNLIPAARQPGLEISVIDDSGKCTAACQTALGVIFTQAIAAWRPGCARCQQSAMMVVKFGAHVWIDRSLAGLIWMPSSMQGMTVQAQNSGVSYEQLDVNAPLVERLCTLQKTSNGGIELARSYMCSLGAPQQLTLKPVIRIMEGATSCGTDPDIVACGIPSGSIEFSLTQREFLIPTADEEGTISLGAGSFPVNIVPVIFHEVGHWFGVPHPEAIGVQSPDVMAGLWVDEPNCISGDSLTLLNNATDRRWPFRAKSDQALRIDPKKFRPREVK